MTGILGYCGNPGQGTSPTRDGLVMFSQEMDILAETSRKKWS